MSTTSAKTPTRGVPTWRSDLAGIIGVALPIAVQAATGSLGWTPAVALASASIVATVLALLLGPATAATVLHDAEGVVMGAVHDIGGGHVRVTVTSPATTTAADTTNTASGG